MAKHTQKSYAIDHLLGVITGAPFAEAHKARATAINSDKCMICKGEATKFTDELSRKEYTISGMCQKCQDETFNEEEY